MMPVLWDPSILGFAGASSAVIMMVMQSAPTQIQISRGELEPSSPAFLLARVDTDPETVRAMVTLSGHGPGVRAALPRVEQAIQAVGHVVVAKLSDGPVGTLHIHVGIWSDLPVADSDKLYGAILAAALSAAVTPGCHVLWSKDDHVAARIQQLGGEN